jgi:hypothetical protein
MAREQERNQDDGDESSKDVIGRPITVARLATSKSTALGFFGVPHLDFGATDFCCLSMRSPQSPNRIYACPLHHARLLVRYLTGTP